MRHIQVNRHGGPEVLELVEGSDPVPGPGQVLIRPQMIGVNYIDTYLRQGLYPSELPHTPGSEGVGVVESCGPGEHRWRVGDRVAWCQVPGSYAELLCAPDEALVSVPEEMDSAVAASALLQGLTAHYLVNDCHRALPGDTVLITAGAGGVGQLLIQMAVARGLHVITTTSTPAKAEICRRLGAHHVLDYDRAEPGLIRDLSGGGVATVFDGVGRDTFDAGLASLRHRGHMVLFGAASGPVPPVDPQRLNSGGSLFLTRPTLAHYISTETEFRERASHVLGALADGSLTLTVGGVFGLSEAPRAHQELQSRRTTGSIVLDPTG